MNQIIIADQDSAARKALTLVLQRKWGTHTILEVDGVEELIRALANTPPDLLLLDWRLYGSPAPETCRLLQRAYPQLKIILLSINAEDAAAAKDSGAAFIYKGASPDELIATLSPFLRKESETSQGGQPPDLFLP